jgi:hypothetical protein
MVGTEEREMLERVVVPLFLFTIGHQPRSASSLFYMYYTRIKFKTMGCWESSVPQEVDTTRCLGTARAQEHELVETETQDVFARLCEFGSS